MADTWIVVADSSRARMLRAKSPLTLPEEFAALEHPESRLKEQDLISDAPGRAFDSRGGGRHAMSSNTSVKRHESEVFAREIADQLERGRTSGAYERLILAAPPAFLGTLRNVLPDAVAALVIRTVDKNLVAMEPAKISDQVSG